MTFFIAAVGALAQFVDGLLGMGYGVSAATMLMALGFAPTMISATVHAAQIPTTAVSGLAHRREGNVERGIALPLAIGGMAGGVFGALALVQLASGNVRPIIALLLLGLGARILVVSLIGRSRVRGNAKLGGRKLVALGLVGGSLDAFGGGGWGPTCTSVLMSTDGREPRKLIGSVCAAEFATTAAIVATFGFRLGAEPFAWATVVPLFMGGVLVAPLAAKACRRVNPKVMGVAVGATLVALNASILAGFLGIEWIRPLLWMVAAGTALTVAVYALRQPTSKVVEG